MSRTRFRARRAVTSFAHSGAGAASGDLGPEGLAFVPGEDSPTGRPLVAVGNEVSGSTTLYDVRRLGRR